MILKNPARKFCRRVFYCLKFIVLVTIGQAHADSATPFLTNDQNPLLNIYGLPLPTTASILQQDENRIITAINISNTINVEKKDNEDLFVDAETYQLDLLLDYGIYKNWMIRIHLPFITNEEGFMDSMIENYHDTLGLPEGKRPLHPRDVIRIQYQLNGANILNIREQQSGIGDISIQTGYQTQKENNFNLSYWASLKLPTGSAEKLTGSDNTDIALWLATDKRFESFWGYANFGLLYMAGSDVLKQQHKNTVLFGTMGLQIQPWDSVILKAQLEGHTAFYDSDTDFLGSAILITFGGTIIFDHATLDIAVAEDIQALASPDVNFNIAWRYFY